MSANELKTKGVLAIQAVLERKILMVISGRGKQRSQDIAYIRAG